MCIMEVRPGQHHSTIAQAQAHNVSTVLGDLELFETLLAASHHSDIETQGHVENIRRDLDAIYARLLKLWGHFLASECESVDGFSAHEHGPDIRAFIEARIAEDVQRARTYETR